MMSYVYSLDMWRPLALRTGCGSEYSAVRLGKTRKVSLFRLGHLGSEPRKGAECLRLIGAWNSPEIFPLSVSSWHHCNRQKGQLGTWQGQKRICWPLGKWTVRESEQRPASDRDLRNHWLAMQGRAVVREAPPSTLQAGMSQSKKEKMAFTWLDYNPLSGQFPRLSYPFIPISSSQLAAGPWIYHTRVSRHRAEAKGKPGREDALHSL